MNSASIFGANCTTVQVYLQYSLLVLFIINIFTCLFTWLTVTSIAYRIKDKLHNWKEIVIGASKTADENEFHNELIEFDVVMRINKFVKSGSAKNLGISYPRYFKALTNITYLMLACLLISLVFFLAVELMCSA